MKRSTLVFLVAAVALAAWWFYTPASPVMAGPRDTNRSVESTITQLERNWAKAIVEKDTGTLDRLLAKSSMEPARLQRPIPGRWPLKISSTAYTSSA